MTAYLLRTDELRLAERFASPMQCVFPEGTVVPFGEAKHAFGTDNIDFASDYNSDGYWFIALQAAEGRSVRVYPISIGKLRYDAEAVFCAKRIKLTRNGNVVKASSE